ncbi:mechanosensitive ion channel [bacterium]|nr:mechanosensitive ion channel [bacterium]
MNIEKIDSAKEYVLNLAMEYGPRVVMAIITLIVGFWIIARFTRWVRRVMEKREIEVSLIPFLTSLISITLKVLLIISVASMVGIATTSFVAVLGAAGLAIGLALQGSLANFAGGVLILMFKPFKVGDAIETQGEIGAVDKITVLNTFISLPNGNNVILPNGMVANDKIKNFTMHPTRRVDLTVGIGYNEDIDKAKQVIMDALLTNEKVLKDPPPMIFVSELADSSVNLAVRPFAKTEDYWDVYFDTLERVKKALDKADIEIPFPQRDIHMKKD